MTISNKLGKVGIFFPLMHETTHKSTKYYICKSTKNKHQAVDILFGQTKKKSFYKQQT